MLPKENSRNTKTETNLDLWERRDTRWGFQEQVFWFVTFFFPKVTNPRVALEVTCQEGTSESYVLTQRKGRRRREQMKKERSPWRCVLERTRFFSLFLFFHWLAEECFAGRQVGGSQDKLWINKLLFVTHLFSGFLPNYERSLRSGSGGNGSRAARKQKITIM